MQARQVGRTRVVVWVRRRDDRDVTGGVTEREDDLDDQGRDRNGASGGRGWHWMAEMGSGTVGLWDSGNAKEGWDWHRLLAACCSIEWQSKGFSCGWTSQTTNNVSGFVPAPGQLLNGRPPEQACSAESMSEPHSDPCPLGSGAPWHECKRAAVITRIPSAFVSPS